jgi:hypothetical protein
VKLRFFRPSPADDVSTNRIPFRWLPPRVKAETHLATFSHTRGRRKTDASARA